jgi:hypothetical protein
MLSLKQVRDIVPEIVTNMSRMVLLIEDITTALYLAHVRQNQADSRLSRLEELVGE